LHKTFAHALDHVIDQRAAETVQRLGLRIVALAADVHIAPIYLETGALWQVKIQFSFRAFDKNLLALHFHLHLWRNCNRLFSNSRKTKILPIYSSAFPRLISSPGLCFRSCPLQA